MNHFDIFMDKRFLIQLERFQKRYVCGKIQNFFCSVHFFKFIAYRHRELQLKKTENIPLFYGEQKNKNEFILIRKNQIIQIQSITQNAPSAFRHCMQFFSIQIQKKFFTFQCIILFIIIDSNVSSCVIEIIQIHRIQTDLILINNQNSIIILNFKM